MLTWKAITKFLALSQLMLLSVSTITRADTNQVIGSLCSGSDDTTMADRYKADLNSFMGSLASNAPAREGFYTASVSDTIYGLVQCRPDVSDEDCRNCIKNLTMVTNCTASRNATIWLTWCFLRYSNTSFFGLWDQSGLAVANDSDYDDQDVVSRGLDFMNKLAATAPKQRLMFQAAVLDVGEYGKRYGMAQCTRDISASDCGNCLYYQMTNFRTTVGNKRDWEIYGSSCSLQYHDYQFYFNFPLTSNEGSITSLSPPQVVVFLVISTLMILHKFVL